jgi:dihydrofolate reductase
MPEVAKGMNDAPKYVFSRTLKSADWSNTMLLKDDPATQIARIKQAPGPDITVLGSGTIVAQLTQAGLVDEIQLLVCPVVLGSGRSQFAAVSGRPSWSLSRSKTFKNGRVFLAYSLRVPGSPP